jgi:hypothetical protein
MAKRKSTKVPMHGFTANKITSLKNKGNSLHINMMTTNE